MQIARHFELIGGNPIAGDSTKLSAQNNNNAEEKEQLFRRRQAIVEHSFWTIKRSR